MVNNCDSGPCIGHHFLLWWALKYTNLKMVKYEEFGPIGKNVGIWTFLGAPTCPGLDIKKEVNGTEGHEL